MRCVTVLPWVVVLACVGSTPLTDAQELGRWERLAKRDARLRETGMAFSELPDRVSFSQPCRIPVSRKSYDQVSRFIFYRIPNDIYLAAFADSGDLLERLLARRKSWVRTGPELVKTFSWRRSRELPVTLDDPGLYVVEEILAEDLVNHSLLLVSDVVTVARVFAGRVLVYATRPEKGRPVAGVGVRLRVDGSPRELTGETDMDGLCVLTTPPGSEDIEVFTTHERVLQAAFLYRDSPPEMSLVYITTDRPLYRPGHEVRFKALRRDRDAGRAAGRTGRDGHVAPLVRAGDDNAGLGSGDVALGPADARVVTLSRPWQVLELPARAEYAPNVYVKLLGVMQDRWRTGAFEIFVYPRSKFIDVKVAADRAAYGPRERAKVSLTLEAAGRPV